MYITQYETCTGIKTYATQHRISIKTYTKARLMARRHMIKFKIYFSLKSLSFQENSNRQILSESCLKWNTEKSITFRKHKVCVSLPPLLVNIIPEVLVNINTQKNVNKICIKHLC